MRTRLDTLARDLAEVRRRVDRIEARLGAETVAAPATQASAPALVGAGESLAPAGLGRIAEAVVLTGRAVLAVGGAYLLRALADAGVAPGGPTANVGLLYAAGWFAAGDRSARAGRRLEGVAHDLVAIVIAYPLLLEATLRLRLFSPAAAAAWLFGFFCVGLWVAGRQHSTAIARLNSIAAVATSLVLLVGTHALLPLSFSLFAMAAVLEREAFRGRRFDLRWLPAAALDAAVAISVWVATRPSGLPPGYPPAPLATVALLCLSLTLLFVLSVVLRTLLQDRPATAFEIVQLPLALLLGLGGAGRALAAAGAGQGAMGWASLLLGAGFSLAAFLVIERHKAPARNFYLYSTAGAGLLLAGTGTLLERPLLAPAWCGIAMGAAILGSRFGRLTLRAHALVYALAAAAASGLLPTASGALVAPHDAGWPHAGAAALLAYLTLLVCYLAPLAFRGHVVANRGSRLAAAATAAAAAWGGGGLAVDALVGGTQPSAAGADAARLAALRTVVVALAAVAIAWAARRFSLRDLSWVASGALVAVGFKLVAEDLSVGRPATLFPALAVYGVALIVAPRLLRDDGGARTREGTT